MITAEVLVFPPTPKPKRRRASSARNTVELDQVLLNALASTARTGGLQATATTSYQGHAEWLVLYGPGARDRVEPIARQLARGGRVICWDAPYWHRGRKLRVSIDHAHPQAWVMRRDWPAARWQADGLTLTHEWNHQGPVLVAAIGTKARVQYGETVATWEADIVAQCRSLWPHRQVFYRPKPGHTGEPPPGSQLAPDGPIEHVLRMTGLVLTWHSNVAIDAIRMGIPVVCRDGAAAAVCPSEIPEHPQPLDEVTRLRFLTNLAWFQWSPTEPVQAWTFLRELLA